MRSCHWAHCSMSEEFSPLGGGRHKLDTQVADLVVRPLEAREGRIRQIVVWIRGMEASEVRFQAQRVVIWVDCLWAALTGRRIHEVIGAVSATSSGRGS